jgi:hypothetical protein
MTEQPDENEQQQPKGPPWWLAAVMSYPCPTCEAEPNHPCITRNGTTASPPHIARGHQRPRCVVCQVLLPQGDMEGMLCDRCALVRSLELERMTRHQRST